MENETVSPDPVPGNLLPHCHPILCIHAVMAVLRYPLEAFLPRGLSVPSSSSCNGIPLGLAQMSLFLTTPRAHITSSGSLATLLIYLFEGQEVERGQNREPALSLKGQFQ